VHSNSASIHLSMPKVVFIECDGSSRVIDADLGVSVMKAAVAMEIPGIIGDCGGCLTCGTCQVYVEPAWLGKMDPPSEPEQAMLECVVDQQPNSRLSCQIVVSEALDGLTVRVPKTQF
jgi:ferredoxin, 2Fe-2S